MMKYLYFRVNDEVIIAIVNQYFKFIALQNHYSSLALLFHLNHIKIN